VSYEVKVSIVKVEDKVSAVLSTKTIAMCETKEEAEGVVEKLALQCQQ